MHKARWPTMLIVPRATTPTLVLQPRRRGGASPRQIKLLLNRATNYSSSVAVLGKALSRLHGTVALPCRSPLGLTEQAIYPGSKTPIAPMFKLQEATRLSNILRHC